MLQEFPVIWAQPQSPRQLTTYSMYSMRERNCTQQSSRHRLSPHSITTSVHERQGMTRHTYDSGITHHMCEEARIGLPGKTKATVEISQGKEVTETNLKCL